ncbi:hypothetical protein Sango_2617900 [Sesamum angolense]|uniref:Uncharacterized protein n=2 Tax=Sesamum TaxID=4181 RepID=A0AAE1W1E3_9LAMI|nr:hypothetical protein Sango_2617900 [Sesamum angolense]
MEGAKVTAGVRKAKKKQVKDELDRIKQAEKKKRRLEKALATSAAIRSELEKKKQKKKEEQERLDEEGAAIAEAVALHVLLGEDSDDSSKMMLKKDEGLTSWDHASNMDIFVGARRAVVPHQDLSKNSEFCPQYFREDGWGSIGLSAGHLAAQAVSSLKIADDARVDAYVFNQNCHVVNIELECNRTQTQCKETSNVSVSAVFSTGKVAVRRDVSICKSASFYLHTNCIPRTQETDYSL